MGDSVVYVAALLFGPLDGLVVGSAFRGTAPFSRAQLTIAVLSIATGGALMVAGYLITEAYILRLGVGAVATELPGNIFQVLGGSVVGVPVALALRRLQRAKG